MITPALLMAVHASKINAEKYAPILEHARFYPDDSFKTISSKSGVAMVVAQLAHESGYYSTLSENLNYTADALRQDNRRKYFTVEQAQLYGAHKNKDGSYLKRADQRMIANLYYGGRLGNRGVDTDDGWDFRGSGLIQLTGLENHSKFAKTNGLPVKESAEFTRTPQGAVESALWYWRTRGLLIPASKGDVTRCTEIIQGADGGLASRIALYKAARSILG